MLFKHFSRSVAPNDFTRRLTFGIERLEDRRVLSAVPTGVPIVDWVETSLNDVAIEASTEDKPQSKAWEHEDKWWAVLTDNSGTWVYGLEGNAWQREMQLSTETGIRADVRAAGDLAHILLFDGIQSEVTTIEYSSQLQTYQPWSVRAEAIDIVFSSGVESATLDVDTTGRLWVASDANDTVEVRHSDIAGNSFSGPIVVGTGITNDDISVITALPDGSVGVFWSNQNAEQFGFRLHIDGTDPEAWLADEIPASDTSGGGVADDHLNVAVASDGTLYAAVKTSFDTSSKPKIALLVRQPDGQWDPLYEVDTSGTRPIVVINELENRLIVAYTESTGGDSIVLRESPLDNISFGAKRTVLSGNLNDVTSTKGSFTDDLVLLATQSGDAASILLSPETPTAPPTDPGPTDPGPTDPPVVGASMTTVFQDGLNGYQGTIDTHILARSASTNYGAASSLEIDGSPESAGLLQWDISSIPTGSQVTSATITLDVTGRSKHDYHLYEMLRGWTEGEATWNQAENGTSWQSSGVQGSLDRGTTALGTFGSVSTGQQTVTLNAAGLAVVQGWIDNPTSNHGVTLQNLDATDGLDFSSRESNSVANRPRLEITYTAAGDPDPAPVETNEAPVVSAGVNRTIQLSGSATLSGSFTDDGLPAAPGAVNVQWTVDSGPGNVTFTNAQSAATTATFSQTGTYVLRLTANDGDVSASDTMNVTVEADPAPVETNEAPVVNAGVNRTIQLSGSATLSGSFTDDGLPAPPAAVNVQWTVDSGPGNVTFTDAQSAATTATFSQTGTYVLRLTANDGDLSASDTMNVMVEADPAPIETNEAPVVSAGVNRTIQLSGSATLSGSFTDDGLPAPPAAVNVQWTVDSGPGNVAFTDAQSATTTATFSQTGTYVLRLTASDGDLSASDTMSVSVEADPVVGVPMTTVFQDGLNGYQGTIDTHILARSASTNYGAASSLEIDGSPESAGLLQWDISSIPTGSQVTSATITLDVTGRSKHDYHLYEMLRGWTEGEATWNQAENGTSWQSSGVQGSLDRGTTALGTFGSVSTGQQTVTLNAAGLAVVQGWIDNPTSNHGVTLQNLDATDGLDFSSRESNSVANRPRLEITYTAAGDPDPAPVETNEAPVVSAGVNRTIQLSGSATLSGSFTDDGLPAPPGAVNVQWTVDSGPGNVTFTNAQSAATTATFSQTGTYVLRLTANDGDVSASDTMNVTVEADPAPVETNEAPVVNAGVNRTIQLSGSATLSGSFTDDGLPAPPAAVNVQWTVDSGPGNVTFTDAQSAATTATFSQTGTYVLRLTANDGDLSASDTMNVMVEADEPTTLNTGLVGHWQLETDGASVPDSTPLGNSATVVGAPQLTPGAVGTAWQLDGNDYGVVADNPSLNPSSEITLSAWIQPDNSKTQYILKKGDKGRVDGYELSLSSKGDVFVRFNEDSSGNSFRLDANTKPPSNAWTHVAATYDGSTIRFYVNGELEATKNANFQIASNSLDLHLGAGNDGYRSFSGGLDDVRIYDRALTADEVQQLSAR